MGLQKGVSKDFSHSGLFSDEYVLFYSLQNVFTVLIFIFHHFPFLLDCATWGKLSFSLLDTLSATHICVLSVLVYIIGCGSTRGEDNSRKSCLMGGA